MEEQLTSISYLKEYYGKILSGTKDLQTNACCTADSLPIYIQEIIDNIDDEIIQRFYGCGSPIPTALDGCIILDLGCGTGRDVYIASKLVGPNGFVVGVDMTDEQLDLARRHIQSQMIRFNYAKSNVEFKMGYIEDLKSIGIKDNSVDIVISNCVINLSPNKKDVFSEIFRVLKPGGELYFSDIFSGRRIPEKLKNDPILYGECLSGALYIEDFRRLLRLAGCLDYRVVSNKRLTIDNPELKNKIDMIDFYSMTIRAFKLPNLEDICEDYGQTAVYLGTMPELPHRFALDDHHIFTTGKPVLVCGNTASMLQETRFSKHFNVTGNRKTHYGPFDCNPLIPKSNANTANSSGACC
ncbi:MAG: methyltransferase domain-containing protein [Spirochaetota bacterium]|nr:methyltransferase domain-containing protein [Spirochaetota bacterium]